MKNNLDMAAVRDKLGITQQVLAEMLEIDRKYVSMIETGIKPLSKKLAIKLERIASIEFHKREQSWTKNPDGTIRDLHTNESGNPNIPFPSQFNKEINPSGSCEKCEKKDAEIAYLRDQLAKALDRIPKPQ